VTGEEVTLVLSPDGDNLGRATDLDALGPALDLLPRATSAFAGGELSLNPAQRNSHWVLTFRSPGIEGALLPALLETPGLGDLAAPTPALEALGQLALAHWWDQWCPEPVPEGLLQADIGVWSWRAGLTRAAFEHLDGDGAASLAAWLSDISNKASPQPLVGRLIAAATDACLAVGPARTQASGLEGLLDVWSGTSSIPASPGDLQDLWAQWDVAQRWNPVPDAARTLGAALKVGGVFAWPPGAVGASVATTMFAGPPRRSVLKAATVDWHAVSPRVLATGEDNIRAVVDWQKKSVRIQVPALRPTSEANAIPLVAQLCESRSGQLVGEALPLVARRGGETFEAHGPMPRELKQQTADQFEPHIRDITYSGPIRTGARASAARAQRFMIRATVASHTIEAMEWLDMAVPASQRHDVVSWVAQAQMALQSVAEDQPTGLTDAPDLGSKGGNGAPRIESTSRSGAAAPMLAALFLALAEQP
jgi:hypothetical protein